MAGSAGAVRAGGAFVEIFAKDGAFQQAMTRVQNRLKAVGTAMRQMGTNLSIGGAALGAPFVLAAREATGFTLAMAQVRANTGATEEQFQRLNAAARRMGVEMGRSPTETANAMSGLAKAGLDAEGTIAAVGPVLALAAADNMELARAVEVVVGTMSQFGMGTADFGSIADRLQAAANASTTSVDAIGESLSYVGPQAQMAGQSFDDVAAALGTLAQGGIRGSMAGTQLARVLDAMGSEEAKFNALGISVRDASGNLRPFMDVLRDLGTATAGMNNADKMQAFMNIFDIRGARAAATLSQLGGEFNRILATVQGSAGAASTKAGQVLESFGGQVQVLGAKFADLKIAVITSMGQTATSVVQGLGRALEVVTQFIERNPQLTITVAAVAGGMLALGVAAIAGGIALQVMSRGIGLLAAGLRILPALFTPVGLAATAAFAAVATGVVVARQLSPAFRRETDGIMAALMQLDFGAAWEIMNLNFAIALTKMAGSATIIFGQIKGFFAATGAFIGDMLIEGIDRFMGVFGADILTIQAGLQQIGVYLRAAFDWGFAVSGMRAALAEIDREAARARARAPTADARAAGRAGARQASADQRQADLVAQAEAFSGTIDELNADLDRAHARLKPKAAGAATPGDAAGQPAGRPGMGVMPVPPGGGAAAAAAGRAGVSVGSFGSGQGLGIGPQLATVEDATSQTAANTARMVSMMEGGGAAGPAAVPAIGRAAPQVQAGMDFAAEVQRLAQGMTAGMQQVVRAITAGNAISRENGGILKRIADNTARGAVFA